MDSQRDMQLRLQRRRGGERNYRDRCDVLEMLIYSDSQNRTCTDCRLNYYGVYYYFGVKTRGVWLRGQGIMNVVVDVWKNPFVVLLTGT